MKLTKANVQFKVDGKPFQFFIVHNLNEKFGLSFNDAFENWIRRTKEYTAKSLCEYIMSKGKEFVAMTETQYRRLSK